MRIIGGAAKGRRIVAPAGRIARPTSDRAREALFAIIAARAEGGSVPAPPLAGAQVLDLFAGSGALGLEALSRGAARAVFVDNDRRALAAIARNINALGFGGRARIVRRDLARGRLPLAGPFDLVFCDPPYGRGLAGRAAAKVAEAGLLARHGLLVVEERAGVAIPVVAPLALLDQRRYGDTCFWFFSLRQAR